MRKKHTGRKKAQQWMATLEKSADAGYASILERSTGKMR